jgi:dTDP-4-amino-4,6-dideoxygalactose transaminase
MAKKIKAVEDCLRDGWLAGFGPRSTEFESVYQNISVKNMEFL